jgi:hypothetical protein
MITTGDRVTVLFSGCKGFGAQKVGECGTVTRVEPLRELVGMYRVEFPDGAWYYLDREVEKTPSAPQPPDPPAASGLAESPVVR